MRKALPLVLLLAACESRPELDVVRLERGQVVDCRGGEYRNGKPVELQVRGDDVLIQNCKITGSIRTIGMARTGEGSRLRSSSQSQGHTKRAQVTAPRRLTVKQSTITSPGYTPIYLGPGTTEATLHNLHLRGSSETVAIYLDAESARNRIEGNVLDVKAPREQIAVDGSAYNRITGNTFQWWRNGGIFLYRNCGEGGTIRHQTPSFNTITDNVFVGEGPRKVWPNSRDGNRDYCDDDKGKPFGSSADDRDLGTGNVILRNF